MNKEEKIVEFLIAHKNNLWTGLIILLGGLAGLFLNITLSTEAFSAKLLPKVFLFVLGISLVVPIIKGLIAIHYEIIRKLK